MKYRLLLLALLLGALRPEILVGQDSLSTTPEPSRVLHAAREVMLHARYCTLVTVGEDGQPQARIVDPFPPDDDLTVWIGTNPVSRKVGQIERDPRVTLLYFDAGAGAYVTLLGTAEKVTEADKKEEHWKSEWAGYYSDAYRGSDYVLLRVTPARLEIVSYAHGLVNDPQTWRPVALDLVHGR